MKELLKYEFNNENHFLEILKDVFPEIEEEDSHKPYYTLVKLGYIVLKSGEYDVDGKEILPAILSDKYCVDILWKEDQPSKFEKYQTFPKKPKHKLA